MSKTSDSACFSAFAMSVARLGWHRLMCAALLFVPLALRAQTLQSWEDQFLNRSKIQSLQNATIDTVQGLITLTPIRETGSQGRNFRAVLSGIDDTFYEPTGISDLPLSNLNVVDIDTVPNEPNVYLVTDLFNRRVFTYNAETNRVVNANLASGQGLLSPQDAFPFIEGNNVLKVLITDSETKRVIKINASNGNLEWFYQTGLLNPSDAIMLPRSQEVLICDTGNNRLVAVDTTTDAVTWEFGNGVFNNPVDVDFDPTSPANVDVYLVTDQNRHRVVLIRRDNAQIVFQFGKTDVAGKTDSTLTFPTDADPLPSGNILIADAGNNRLIEVDRQGRIVWRYASEVFGIRDADRIASGIHRDKTIVALKDNAASSVVTAKRLVYKSEDFISQPQDFGQQVDFDSLLFTANTPTETAVRLQLRTVKDLSDTSNAIWFGPTSTTDFYTSARTAINHIHDGDRFYQFRASLITQNRLKTPELTSVNVKATFFRADTQGVVLSTMVRDTVDAIVTNWRTVSFTTELPIAANNSIVVDVLDSSGSKQVASFQAGQAPGNRFDIDADHVPALKGHQSLSLRATLRTTSPFVSPRLLSWAVEWNSVKLGPSQTKFVNASATPVSRFRFSTTPGDSVYVQVVDPNVLPLRDSVRVEVRSSSGDVENLFLPIERVSRAVFRSKVGLRLVLGGQTVTNNNRLLEVHDRDVLTVSYADPYDPADQSSATATVIQRTLPKIQIEDGTGVKRDTVEVGARVFVRVLGETDQSFSAKQDTIYATVFDPRTTDSETLTLVEQESAPNVYNTGIFRNAIALFLDSKATQPGDGGLYVSTGSSLTARYQDPSLDEPAVIATAFVKGPTDVLVQSADKYFLQIAPNPYRVARNQTYKIRVQVRAGELTLRRVEIFNLAGEQVAAIPDGQIQYGGSSTINSDQGAVDVLDWWNLLGDDAKPVATGTYFAKFHLSLTDAQGVMNQVTDLQKVVILQQ